MKRARLGKDAFRAILGNEEELRCRTDVASKPVKALADLITQSQALLPPTTATLTAFRNIISWHGAEFLVKAQSQQTDSSTVQDDNGINSALTSKTTKVMRGYLEERGGEGVGDLGLPEDATVLRNLLPTNKAVAECFTDIRDTFRQLFLWPAILATLFEGDSD